MLFHPLLHSGVRQILSITQHELAYLVGLSRPRVNESLSALQAHDTMRDEYGNVRVLNLPAPRSI